MNVRDYFLEALRNKAAIHKTWVLMCFGYFTNTPPGFYTSRYNYMLERINGTLQFWKDGEYTAIDHDVLDGQPLMRFYDEIHLEPGELENVKEAVDTHYGNCLYNALTLCYNIGDRIPFVTGIIDVPKEEQKLVAMMVDDPEEGQSIPPGKISVSEFLDIQACVGQYGAFDALCVPAASPKTLTADPNRFALKEKLLKENADRLHDPAVIAKIDQETEAQDRAWVDDFGKRAMTDRIFKQARRKIHYMYGFEKKDMTTGDMVLITKSLAEGHDIKNLPAIINSLREASSNRANNTEFGGVETKLVIRALQNAKITDEDCRSLIGVKRKMYADTVKRYHGFYYIDTTGKPVLITPDNSAGLVDKIITMRSARGCRVGNGNFCKTCMGVENSMNVNGVAALAATNTNTFLLVFMKKMHVSGVSVARYNYRRSIT